MEWGSPPEMSHGNHGKSTHTALQVIEIVWNSCHLAGNLIQRALNCGRAASS